MAGRGRGGGVTPDRVVSLLKQAVANTSQVEVAKATGLTRLTVQRYIKGIGEPSQSTLEKIADYFEVTISWLRGEDSDTQALSYDELSGILCTRGLGVPLEIAYRITKKVMEVLEKKGIVLPETDSPERLNYINEIKKHVKRECGVFLGVHRNDGEDVYQEVKNIVEPRDSSQTKNTTNFIFDTEFAEFKKMVKRLIANASAEEKKKIADEMIVCMRDLIASQ